MTDAEKIKLLLEEGWDAYWAEDYEKAFKSYLEANKLNPEKGNYMLSMMCEFGDGTAISDEDAKKYLRRSAQQEWDGINYAAEHLRSLEGDGINRRHTDEWVHNDEVNAMCDEAAEYLLEDYGKPNYKKGVTILRDAAMAGSAFACNLLGYTLNDPMGDVEPYYEEARYWQTLGVQGGDGDCARQLAATYYIGRGLDEPDYTECVYWSRKAAYLGEVGGMRMLGNFYFGGILGNNYAKAEFWYRHALKLETNDDFIADIEKCLEQIDDAKKKLSEEELADYNATLDEMLLQWNAFTLIRNAAEAEALKADRDEKQRILQEKYAKELEQIPKVSCNAVLVRADGGVMMVAVDVLDRDSRAKIVDAQTTDKILTAKLAEFGQKTIGANICGFCDGNGYASDKDENHIIEQISGYDVIIGDVVLCGCVDYDYAPLTSEQVLALLRALMEQ